MNNISTIVNILSQKACQQPEKIAYTFLQDGKTPSGSLTYQQLERQAKSIAACIQSQIQPGERALLLYPQGLELMAAFFGCLYAGACAVPTPAPDAMRLKRSLPRLQAIAKDAQISLVLTTSSLLEQLEEIRSQVSEFSEIPWLATDTVGTAAETWRSPVVSEDTIAYLQYTSGSTSTPKGVIITHENLMHNLACMKQAHGYRADSIAATWMPYFHDFGLVQGLIQPLYVGIPCYVMSPLAFIKRPMRWLEIISRYRVTHSGAPNFAYDYCVERATPEELANLELSSWRQANNGAEPIHKETVERFVQTFSPYGFKRSAFYFSYGLAEATLIVTTKRKRKNSVFYTVSAEALGHNRVVETSTEIGQSLAGCGHAISDDTKVKIVHPETLTECAADEVGEIWVLSPSVAKGYWNRPHETKQTFHAYLTDTGAGPFLRTGDLGFLKDGELVVTGRLKDIIIIRGQNYYPQDIEWTIEKSHPEIRANCTAAFAVEVAGGEQVVVAGEVERFASKNLDVDEVVGAIRKAVAQSHELPLHAVVLLKRGSILKTSSGKIQRQATKAGFLNGSLDALASWTFKLETTQRTYTHPENGVESELVEIWQLALGVTTIGTQDNFFDLGGDSLKAATVLAEVEKRLGQDLPLATLIEAPTIQQLASLLLQPEWLPRGRSLVPLQPQGNKRPFFYVHPMMGSVMLFVNLARHFDRERPLYGLQAVGLDGKQAPYTRIEDMAAHYIKEIQTIQPTGPYLLGGRCFGGIVAFEMAQQLQKQGQEVALVVMVETDSVHTINYTREQGLADELNRIVEQISSSKAKNLYQAIVLANNQAIKSYAAQAYSGRIVYFRASEHIAFLEGGWAKVAAEELEIEIIPGGHISIDYSPTVRIFAALLSAYLDRGRITAATPNKFAKL